MMLAHPMMASWSSLLAHPMRDKLGQGFMAHAIAGL